jgi:hypothetical protein
VSDWPTAVRSSETLLAEGSSTKPIKSVQAKSMAKGLKALRGQKPKSRRAAGVRLVGPPIFVDPGAFAAAGLPVPEPPVGEDAIPGDDGDDGDDAGSEIYDGAGGAESGAEDFV